GANVVYTGVIPSGHSCAYDSRAVYHAVIEEKDDGCNCGMGIAAQAELSVFTRNPVLESPRVPRPGRPLELQISVLARALPRAHRGRGQRRDGGALHQA